VKTKALSKIPRVLVSGFESTQPRERTSIRTVGEGNWTVVGNLTLHGETRSITIDVHNDGGAYVGESRTRQTQFWIHPVSAAGGAVKVKDELKIDFVIVVVR
jgi:hypothetical protein